MSRNATKLIKPNLKIHLFTQNLGPLLGFALIGFFFSLADAIMSYFSPVYIEGRISNSFIMGLILSASSAVGILADVFLGAFTKNRRFTFFLKFAIIGGILFPLIFLLLPAYTPVLLLAMAIWGVYFELNLFSRNHFIHEHTSHEFHDLGWGIIQAFNSVAYLVGPIIAGFLYEKNMRLPLIASAGVFFLAFLAFLFFSKSLKFRNRNQPQVFTSIKTGILHELKVWLVLFPFLWPLILFMFMLMILDSTIWSVGAILSDSLAQTHEWGGFLISLYMAPSLFVGVLAHKLGKPFGKKRAAFVTTLIGGLVLILAGITENVSAFLLLIFTASIFTSLAWPEIFAVFEDYIDRLGKSSSDLVGLENTTTSLSFVIGPILAGGLAELVGEQTTFAVIGSLLVGVCIVCLIVVPRKVHLPQSQLKQVG